MNSAIRNNLALRLVGGAPFYEERISSADSGEPHSLHSLLSYPYESDPISAAYFIEKFSKRGNIVLDPFCGAGSVCLEASILGRIVYAGDENPLAIRVASAKLHPADLSEVTLKLQGINLRRPVGLEQFRGKFSPFYDPETFREIFNLKQALRGARDRVSLFVQALVLGILHGHSAGYLSVYTFPQFALSPKEQEELNLKRRQSPDARPLAPRALRKAAGALRDGIPSVVHSGANAHRLWHGDARNLNLVQSASVDLVVTAPPLPGMAPTGSGLWLREWFVGIEASRLETVFSVKALEEWLSFMNESLLELARVCKSGARCVLELRELRARLSTGEQPAEVRTVSLDEEVRTLVSDSLAKFWDAECRFIEEPKTIRVRGVAAPAGDNGNKRYLVLRRR